MSQCKNCDKEFTPCARKWRKDIEHWSLYACSETCAEKYIESVKLSRLNIGNIRQKNELHEEVMTEVIKEGIGELQSASLKRYKK